LGPSLPHPPLPPPPLPPPPGLALCDGTASGPRGDQASAPPTHCYATFAEWLEARPLGELREICESYSSFYDAQRDFVASASASRSSSAVAVKAPRPRAHAFKVQYRLAIGRRYLEWQRSDVGLASKDSANAFAKTLWSYPTGAVPKKDKQFLHRCRILALAVNDGTIVSSGRANKVADLGGRVKREVRCRFRGRQGRPVVAEFLDEAVWDWFVMMRSAVVARIPPKLVLMKAKAFAAEAVSEMQRANKWVLLPSLDKHWLHRWKLRHGVSLRKPNERYKVSRRVLKERLRAMWLTTVRIRALALYALKRPELVCVGFDQKGLHMNEAGSKNVGSLEIRGVESVRLKECHAATRQRLTLMTSVTSCPAEARGSEMPLEILFKGKSNKVLKDIELPPGVRASLAYGPKGSYRVEHVLRFLRRWLLPWTEDRALANDYRLLFLDAFAAHLDPQVADFAWGCGYVVVYHGGGTTGVAQVNDTDLHAELERAYIENEVQSFLVQQLHDPGNISRSRQQVVTDALTTWLSLHHTAGVSGHKRVGITNALDGSEDALVSRTDQICWAELCFGAERDAAVALVKSGVEEGRLQWSRECIETLREPFPDNNPGEFKEGAEVEPSLAKGEVLYMGDDEPAPDSPAEEAPPAPASALLADLVVAAPEDAPEVVEVVRAHAERQSGLEAMLDMARRHAFLTLQVHADKELKRLKKTGARLAAPESKASACMSRFLKRSREEADRRLGEARALAAVARVEARKVKSARQRLNLALAAKQLARAKAKAEAVKARGVLEKALSKIPKEYGADELGQGHPKGGTEVHTRNRYNLLVRFRARTPPFEDLGHPDMSLIFELLAREWALASGTKWGVAVGVNFANELNAVIADLGSFYRHPRKTKRKEPAETDNRNAFYLYMAKVAVALGKSSAATKVSV